MDSSPQQESLPFPCDNISLQDANSSLCFHTHPYLEVISQRSVQQAGQQRILLGVTMLLFPVPSAKGLWGLKEKRGNTILHYQHFLLAFPTQSTVPLIQQDLIIIPRLSSPSSPNPHCWYDLLLLSELQSEFILRMVSLFWQNSCH